MNDTSPEIDEKLCEMFQKLSPEQRMKNGIELMQAGWKFAEIAVRRRNPNLSGKELQVAVFRWIYQSSCTNEFLDFVSKQHLQGNNSID